MNITAEQIKTLRNQTGVSVMQCRMALEEASGDEKRALEILREKSAEIAAKKSGRALGAGTVAAYIHTNGSAGALVELLCETDFVAKNDLFRESTREIAMHATAMKPASNKELLAQESFKRPGLTINQIIAELSQKFGERVELGRFVVFSVNS